MLTRRLTLGWVLAAVLGLVLAVAGGAGAASQRDVQDDPCRTRPPTLLDRLPEWRCVGLAKFHAKG